MQKASWLHAILQEKTIAIQFYLELWRFLQQSLQSACHLSQELLTLSAFEEHLESSINKMKI